MKKTILLLLLFAGVSAQADVAIFKAKILATKTGRGSTEKVSLAGWFIDNLSGDELAFVKVYPSRKRFTVEWPDFAVHNVMAAGAVNSLVIAIPGNGVGGFFAKGKTSVINVGGSNWHLPKTAVVSGSDLFRTEGENYLQEYTGSLTFDASNTVAANKNKLTVSAAVRQFREYLKGQGFQEE